MTTYSQMYTSVYSFMKSFSQLKENTSSDSMKIQGGKLGVERANVRSWGRLPSAQTRSPT